MRRTAYHAGYVLPNLAVVYKEAPASDFDLSAAGHACDETKECMPLTHSLATRLGKTLTEARKSGELWWLRPDALTKVTIEYLQQEDGSVSPLHIRAIVVSTQHAEPSLAMRRQEVQRRSH